MPITTDAVRTYYDENTSLFLKFSGSQKAQNIHRSLWMNDTASLEDALNTSNALIQKEIESVAPKMPALPTSVAELVRACFTSTRVCKTPPPPLD
jgi:hypothetical protein